MLNLGWHRDTYVEKYHRAFPNRYTSGRTILKCRILDEHIGGLGHRPRSLRHSPSPIATPTSSAPPTAAPASFRPFPMAPRYGKSV